MTNEQLCALCALALAAVDSSDAMKVLDDALEERGETVWTWTIAFANATMVPWRSVSDAPRAIAAVLLFGSWPTRWELAERCRQRGSREDLLFLRETLGYSVDRDGGLIGLGSGRRR